MNSPKQELIELEVISSVMSSEKDEDKKKVPSESSLANSTTKSNGVSQVHDSSKSETSKSYKEKISSHFENIKQKTIRNHNLNKSKAGSKKINRQDEIMPSKRFHRTLDGNPFVQNQNFFCDIKVTEEDNNKHESTSSVSLSKEKEQKFVFYSLPQSETFHVKLSKKESIITSVRKLINTDTQVTAKQRCLEEGLYVNQNPNIKKRDISLLEQRLLATNDKKWFNSYGNLEFLENPLVTTSMRPEENEKPDLYYEQPITKEKCEDIVIIKENILDIDITKLKFTHHPLFSLEHVLAEKLCNLYEQYTHYTKSNNTDRIRTQLEALRYLRKNIENKKATDDHALQRAANVDKDIRKLRKTYLDEAKNERDNLKDILYTWKMLKRIRESQKYSNTNLKLLIKKEIVDCEADSLRYKATFKETLEEVVKEAKVDQQKKSSKSSDENSERSSTDNVDKNEIRKNLQNAFHQSFRSPGEPILKLSLSNNHEITKEVEYNKETTRRNTVKSIKIYLNVSCDKITVCKSKPVSLNEDFLLDINETFSIQLQEVPKYLYIEVIEQPKGLLKKKICDVSIPIPVQNITSTKRKQIKTTFTTNDIVHYKHAGVGSGVNLREVLENSDLTVPHIRNYKLTTEGYIEYCIGWQKTNVAKKDTLREEFMLLKDITDKNLALNVSKLSEWMAQSVPDPQDPGNVVFFEYVASYDPNLFKSNNNFRLSPHMDGFKFCNISEIERNIRFRILQFRNQNEIEFDGVVVPNRIKEIPFNALDNIKKRKNEENRQLFEEDENDETDTQRNCGRKFLRQVHAKVFQMCKNSDNNLIYESVVDEKYLAHFEILVKTVLKNFLSWFYWQPRKPLSIKNVPREKTLPESNKVGKQCKVTIKIISGKNIPNRTKHKSSEPSVLGTSSSNVDYMENEIKPFVEVSYENVSIRTNTSSGVNPVWNETLILPLEYHNIDYLNPHSLKATIVVNLYDECDSTFKYQNKKRQSWLGAVEIPLSAVCYSTSMSGLFKVKLAELLLGYETETERNLRKSPTVNSSQNCATYFQMEISVAPNVPKLIANMESLPCGDIPYIQQHILKWNDNYNNSFPNRKFSALAIDANAKTTCITRYLKPLEPPQINLEEFDVTPEQCLRYVSLIPFTECNQFYHNVWLSTNELVRLMIGSVIDHAVALTCYLLALKIDAWLLLGYGIPHGSTAYVLTREYVKDGELPMYSIYDVVYNDKYNLIEPHCPLQRIYCLVNGENVWANTQRSDNLNITRFDLSRKSDWLSLFNNTICAPTHFINNKVVYSLRDKTKTDRLETRIEIQIKKKIRKLRQLERTIWNHNLASEVKNALRSFEINSMYNKSNFETINELNRKLTTSAVTGYVLNSAFLNMSTIIKNIKKLGICGQENSNNEFALAVYIHVYPGPLLSLWIFIGNVIKQDDV